MELRVLLYMHYLIQKNIIGGGIRCRYNRYKNKKFLDLDVTIHLLQKGFMEKYLSWLAHEESYVPYETMVERTVGSTSSSNNLHGVACDNSNRYRSIYGLIYDVLRKHNFQMKATCMELHMIIVIVIEVWFDI